MKILSIDPGIKNLAFCLFERIENINGINGINGENKYIIKKWDTINLSEEKKEILCQTKGCTKPAKFCSQCIQTQPQSLYFCLKHAKEKIKDSKDSLQIPKREQQMSFIKKQKIQELQNIANQYNIHFNLKTKKTDLLKSVEEYIVSHFYVQIETQKCGEVNLCDIGRNIKTHFDTLFLEEEKIDYVLIENQIGPIANRMKTIQGMIVQYFIMSTILVDKFEFISASNKLKMGTMGNEVKSVVNDSKPSQTTASDKKAYTARKKNGISICINIISNENQFKDKLDYFNSHKKKDDLSDAFLQGMWFIREKIKHINA